MFAVSSDGSEKNKLQVYICVYIYVKIYLC